MRSIAYAVLVLLGHQCVMAAPIDSCAGQVLPTLKNSVEKAYPDYRLPLETDNLAGDVSHNRKHGGKGCLGYASADFNGDGKADAVVALTHKEGEAAIVVAAFATGSTWSIHELKRWKANRSRLYVEVGKPARYDRAKSLDGPLGRGEVGSLICPHSVAIFGATEASGAAYCFKAGRWQHVWISD
jgi:hypothetical protein